MAKDILGDRYEQKLKKGRLGRLAKKGIDPDLLESEEQLLAETKPVDPIKKEASAPNRNDPCPCGSGKKYKRCCG